MKRTLITFVMGLHFVALPLWAAQAATYYVDKNHPGKNDNNPGTESQPWKTLTKAANTAQAGDTVMIKAGTYNETLAPQRSGTAGNLITFMAYPGEECQGEFAGTKNSCQVILDGQGTLHQGVILNGKSYVRIEGFEIRKYSYHEVVDFRTNSHNIEFVNNYIHHTGYQSVSPGSWGGGTAGIVLNDTYNTLIENNELTYLSAAGISFGNANNVTVRGNNIHHNGDDGIYLAGTNQVIEFNRMYDNVVGSIEAGIHADGIVCEGGEHLTIRYNTISDFTQLIYIALPAGVVVRNIDIYGNVFYNDVYWFQVQGGLPAIFFELRYANTGAQDINIYANTFGYVGDRLQPGSAPIWFNPSGSGSHIDNVTVRSNIFSQCTNNTNDAAILNTGGTLNGFTCDYNLYYRSRPYAYEPHSLSANPQFVDYQGPDASSFDFHLLPTSPAIDAGNFFGINLPSPFVDIDGTTRPQGVAFDLGAYEYLADSLGDLNCDGTVNYGDVNPFVMTLTNPSRYEELYPNCDIMNGDINGDGLVNFGDINPFVAVLTAL